MKPLNICIFLLTCFDYRHNEFHGFRLLLVSLLFLSQFWPLLKHASFCETAGAVAKIGSSLKLNQHCQI